MQLTTVFLVIGGFRCQGNNSVYPCSEFVRFLYQTLFQASLFCEKVVDDLRIVAISFLSISGMFHLIATRTHRGLYNRHYAKCFLNGLYVV